MKKIESSEEKISKKRNAFWNVITIISAVVIAFVLSKYVILISVVVSGSMEPTLPVGNTVVYNKLSYRSNTPVRGDIVVFYSEEFQDYFGKRIIGLPGDQIEFKDGKVWINGSCLNESDYIDKNVPTYATNSFTVPEKHYFMLGDNRINSRDSRFWKEPYISENSIIGKYLFQFNFSFQYDIIKPLKNLIAKK